MSEKFYAVRKGRKTGIFHTWEECKNQVHGYAGAEFKSFKNLKEAEDYLDSMEKNCDRKSRTDTFSFEEKKVERGTEKRIDKRAEKRIATEVEEKSGQCDEHTIIAYVDGSYNGSDTEFSYGMVILDGSEEYRFSKKITDEKLAKMNNVAGEIAGAMAAMEYGISHNKKKVIIYHDYEGISKWCLGEWKTNKEGTTAYKKYYDEVKKSIEIEFVKVKGHSNDKYNDMADELAKKALNL